MDLNVNEYFLHEGVTPTALDYLWARGWRHFGKYFYRYSWLPQDEQVYHVLPLRIRLEHHQLRRIHKRIIKANSDLQVTVRPAYVDDAVEQIFHRHKQRFSHNVPESIYNFISQRPATVPCECHSISVLCDDELIGISYLDIGDEACSSVTQCFEPSYERRSLGIYMVLQAIRYTAYLNKHLYYHGYAYQEASHYDYKKQFHGLEAYDWKGQWLPFEKQV